MKRERKKVRKRERERKREIVCVIMSRHKDLERRSKRERKYVMKI